MPYDPEKHHRHAMRYHGSDYLQAGAYFVTQCIAQRRALLGQVKEGVILSPAGLMIEQALLGVPQYYKVGLDHYVIMPDHFHAIFLFEEDGGTALFDVMRRFKTFTATNYRKAAERGEWDWLEGGLWQRSYYDRILRNEGELENARRYIVENPQRWLNIRRGGALSPPET